ncbi:aminodeoxychorismate lyase [Corynebacterium uterequi]|uniref:Branched-chain amino acid aminotransferase/4-amino-4-deoxychorismate lyase n=1 Tax=Corynebacterium uterequi TaxID=1072256 RepID=A0A0G3HEN5_9CORY|nr:aminodeoxychorismate lyase [Corynebacterium uterequi]AKK11811.1 branched-chain amino acid aminotransferase/4-amino-4-deoxychorismate lyase [Corynebacterium uterequi]
MAPTPIISIIEPFGGSVRSHNASLPHVYFDDRAVTRGDAVVETLLLRAGTVVNIERHVDRFVASAAQLGLPEVHAHQWVAATVEAAGEWERRHEGVEARCTWTLSRGRESTGLATAWLVVTAVGQRPREVKVMSTTRGYRVEDTPPAWLPAGAKTINYAATLAAVRYAQQQGFDDVLFCDTPRGRVLEGSTSSVIVVKEGRKLRTPVRGGDIVPSTTQAALFDAAQQAGWRCKEKRLSYNDLLEADSVWLLSSTRLAVRIRRLDDHKLPAGRLDDEFRQLVETTLG